MTKVLDLIFFRAYYPPHYRVPFRIYTMQGILFLSIPTLFFSYFIFSEQINRYFYLLKYRKLLKQLYSLIKNKAPNQEIINHMGWESACTQMQKEYIFSKPVQNILNLENRRLSEQQLNTWIEQQREKIAA